MSAIQNRLKKNFDKLKPWADRIGTEAFRLYDRDIPEYPFVIEVFNQYAILWDRSDFEIDRDKSHHLTETLNALTSLGYDRNKTVVKKREIKDRRSEQYSPLSRRNIEVSVLESGHHFLINPYDYLDCGLFLDHRLLRKLIADEVKDVRKKQGRCSVLNLFCYTGSISVYAAKAGATVTSADLSSKYLDWSERNFIANHLMTANHRFLEVDILDWLKSGEAGRTGPYDIVVCDPPTFSNSKKMVGTFDVERDHKWLIGTLLTLLKDAGVLFFSTNKRGFKIDPAIENVVDISEKTLPKDFHDSKIRKAYRIIHS